MSAGEILVGRHNKRRPTVGQLVGLTCLRSVRFVVRQIGQCELLSDACLGEASEIQN